MIVLFSVIVFVFGLLIGSFLNCVIWRLQTKEGLWGRSYCPHCRHVLHWVDLFPVISFTFLGGKCRYCHSKISWQYPFVEFLTGLAFFITFTFVSAPWGQFSWLGAMELCFLLYIVSSFIIMAVYDLRHFIIPDAVLIPAILISIGYRLFESPMHLLLYYAPAALFASGFFLFIFLISQGNWMGFGDVKLAILLGLLVGFPNILVALFLAFLFGAIIGLILIGMRKGDMKSQVPFAPFLIFGTFVALLFGQTLIAWYVNFFIVS